MTKKLTFEESFKRLEDIVSKLEKGEISLEESLKLFEEGQNHVKECMARLQQAQAKVEKLSRNADGDFSTEPFE